MTKLKADVVLRCFRIVAAVTLLACGRCAPSIHDTHVPRRTTPLSRDNARLSFEVARPPFLIFYFGFEEIAENFRRGVSPFVLERTRTSPSAFAAASASSIVNVSPFLLSLPPDGRNSKKRVKARRHLRTCHLVGGPQKSDRRGPGQ